MQSAVLLDDEPLAATNGDGTRARTLERRARWRVVRVVFVGPAKSCRTTWKRVLDFPPVVAREANSPDAALLLSLILLHPLFSFMVQLAFFHLQPYRRLRRALRALERTRRRLRRFRFPLETAREARRRPLGLRLGPSLLHLFISFYIGVTTSSAS